MLRHLIRSTFNAHSVGFRSVRLVANVKTAAKNEDVERVLTAIDQLESLPEHVKDNDNRFAPIARDLSDVVPFMNQHELYKTLDLLAARRHRNVDVLKLITQKMMELDANPPPRELLRTTVNLKRLSFYYPPLYDFIASKFIYRINEFSRWSQIASIVDAFARMQINNRGFWKLICSWMDTHIDNIPLEELNSVQRTVSGCAIVNVPSELLRRPVQKVNQRLIESIATKRKATEWLNLVHSLAIVSSLTSEAKRVFFPGFFNELRQTLTPSVLFRSAVHILQIASAIRHDLKEEPTLPSEITRFLEENESLTEKYRYRNNVYMQSDLEVFRQTLYLIADVNTHATPPHLDMNTGAFVDAMLWIDPKRKVVLPLNEGPTNPDAQQVAVIYGTQNLMTRRDGGAADNFNLPPTRPLGEIQMNLRHLHARNIRPVFIGCHELQNLESNEHKLPFIRDRIWSSGDYAEENWI
ncbi:hypothetical protein M3Y95_01014000 [Aphelenchoides besseyi]|nr:hypothetical protein M3Y95_01014000 [Aphelenchoides besseyi]